MKKNENEKIDGCFYCNFSSNGLNWKCMKFGHEANSTGALFEKCRLSEVKEIKVWFEKRPNEADMLDYCVYFHAESEAKGEFPWIVELNIRKSGIWIDIMACSEKEQAEAFLGCKIPE